jgi:hypothetical protein
MAWLLLLHQIPPKPPYFRAKILRRLAQIGATAVKNSAYVLPESDEAREDFEWIYREIISGGGSAWLFRAEALEGFSNGQVLDAVAAAANTREYVGRTWVTRAGIKVDRIGSAWLVRRFIDPQATFQFVDTSTYKHASLELRFDMYEGEFTHEGELCTFEVLIARFDLLAKYPALRPLAEMVHDIDLKDERYKRSETSGLSRMLDGLCARTKDDELRLQQGSQVFDALYESFVE